MSSSRFQPGYLKARGGNAGFVQFNWAVRRPLLPLQQADVTADCVKMSEKMKQIQVVVEMKSHP